MGRYRRLIPLIATLSCSSAPRPTVAPSPAPQDRRDTHPDSLAAALDAFLIAKLLRNTCRMPVVRGDASHDTAMVLPRRRHALPPAFRIPPPPFSCYNPLFSK